MAPRRTCCLGCRTTLATQQADDSWSTSGNSVDCLGEPKLLPDVLRLWSFHTPNSSGGFQANSRGAGSSLTGSSHPLGVLAHSQARRDRSRRCEADGDAGGVAWALRCTAFLWNRGCAWSSVCDDRACFTNNQTQLGYLARCQAAARNI